MKDPTKEELLDYLKSKYGPHDLYDWAAEEAIYWYAYNWHGGQNSNLYSVLSTSPFTPARNQNHIDYDDKLTWSMYNSLEKHFSNVVYESI